MNSETTREDVRLVKLEPLRCASFYGFGPQPEEMAWGRLEAWARPRGYLEDLTQQHVFGFNNPNPSPGSPNYGYEFWLALNAESEPEVVPEEEMRIVSFGGGDYAVLRADVADDAMQAIPDGWKRLHRLCEEQGLHFGSHQWLERHLSVPSAEGGFTLDLYMPIVR